jgi:ParB family transcriptional regulator, chromosome partitioning protein
LARKRGLGRGLDALLSDAGLSSAQGAGAAGIRDGELRELPIDLLDRGRYQPRTRFEPKALESLADSIRAQGVVQPIVVRPAKAGGRFEIIAGERRWRAAQMAGVQTVPAVVRDIADDAALAIALIENIQREDLNPLEEARALRRLIDEFEMTHQAAADAVGRSRAAISNALRLLDLDPEVATHLEEGDIEMGHARALLALDSIGQRQAAERIIAKGMTARDAEALVRSMLGGPKASDEPRPRDADVHQLQERLAAYLGAGVSLQHRQRGNGKLTINYANLEQLDGILERIGVPSEDAE